MGIVLELAVNFGTNSAAADAAAHIVRDASPVLVQGVSVEFEGPYVGRMTAAVPYLEFTVTAAGIHNPRSDDALVRRLTDADVTRIGEGFYDLLRRFDGYRVGVVGWDPEDWVDVESLHDHWLDGDLSDRAGLVVADDLCDRWGLGSGWERFADGYRWRPYEGTGNPFRDGA